MGVAVPIKLYGHTLEVHVRLMHRELFCILFSLLFYFILFIFLLFRATLAAYGSSQARGQIRAVAASLHHSHKNARSETHV